MVATEKQVKKFVDLFQRGTRLTYKKGEFIIRPGERPPGVFYIEDGLVKAYDITKYGEENLLIIRKSNEIFPLIWAITGQERDIIYQALGPVVVWRLSQEEYLEHLYQHTDVLPPLLDMVVEMYRIHSERIINLEYRSVRERLISFLLTMASRFGGKVKEGILIEVPLKHQDIATPIASVPAVDRMHLVADEICCLSVLPNYMNTNHYYEDNALPSHVDLVRTIETIVLNWK